MKTITSYILILFSFLLSTFTYSQTCTRPIPSFDAAPGGYTINGGGLLEAVNDAITLYFNENFSTQSGPDLHVYLAIHFEAPSTPGNTNVDLGVLSSNSGAQSYSIPSGVTLDEYSYVLIHCLSFNHWWGGGLLGDIDCSTATNNPNGDLSVSIYPNPTQGILTLGTKSEMNIDEISIMDITGKLLLKKSYSSPQVKLDLSDFPASILLLGIRFNNRFEIMKRVVKY